LVFWALWGRVLPLLSDSLGRRRLEVFWFFVFHFPWSYGPSIVSGNSEIVSPDGWLVSSICSFCPQSRLQFEPVCARWSDLLFLPGGSCVALPLQPRLVSCSPARWGNLVLSTALSPMGLAQQSTTPCFRRLAFCPTPALSLCSLPLLPLLRVQLLAPPPFSRVGSTLHPTPTVDGRLQFTVYAFSFVQCVCVCGVFNLPRGFTGLCSGGWVRESCVVSVAHLMQIYSCSFEAGWQARMVCHFSQADTYLDWVQPSRCR
jgi:hypothetical protein